MEYKWIAQDKDGEIYKYRKEPEPLNVSWFDPRWRKMEEGEPNKDWKNSLINLETHDYKIEDGILMKVEKEQAIFTASELQYNDTRYPSNWVDCTPYLEYRIKPKTKVVRFRNYINDCGYIGALIESSAMPSNIKWLGDWQEVTIEA